MNGGFTLSILVQRSGAVLKQILWLSAFITSCCISHVWFWFMLKRFFSDQKLWSAYVSRGFKILQGAWRSDLGMSLLEHFASRAEWGCFDPGKQIKFHLKLQQNFLWGRGRGLCSSCSDLLILSCCIRKISSLDIAKKSGFWTHGFSVLL